MGILLLFLCASTLHLTESSHSPNGRSFVPRKMGGRMDKKIFEQHKELSFLGENKGIGYYIERIKVTNDGAHLGCLELGLQLATLTYAYQLIFIFEVTSSEDDYAWVDGTKTQFTNGYKSRLSDQKIPSNVIQQHNSLSHLGLVIDRHYYGTVLQPRPNNFTSYYLCSTHV